MLTAHHHHPAGILRIPEGIGAGVQWFKVYGVRNFEFRGILSQGCGAATMLRFSLAFPGHSGTHEHTRILSISLLLRSLN